MERIYPLPKDAQHYHLFELDNEIKAHKDYVAAKAGDEDAAFRLVINLALTWLQGLKQAMPTNCIFVAPYAKEATGDNAIPLILSLVCSELFLGLSDTEIVQQQKVFHTGANAMERLITRPTFEGKVEDGENYILVDDVTTMGGTLAELANYIQLNGGKVRGTITLVNAGRDKRFAPATKNIKLLQERFGDDIKKIFGIHSHALTANEANYLIGFRTLDEIRNRKATAEKEINLRLLSKGIS